MLKQKPSKLRAMKLNLVMFKKHDDNDKICFDLNKMYQLPKYLPHFVALNIVGFVFPHYFQLP